MTTHCAKHITGLVACLAFVPGSASSLSLVDYSFEGTVRDIVSGDFGGPSARVLALLEQYGVYEGADTAGGWRADVAAADRDPNPRRGQYHDSTLDAFLNIGSVHMLLDPGIPTLDAIVLNYHNDPIFHDYFNVSFFLVPDVPQITDATGWLNLRDSDETALNSDDYPVEELLPLSMWDAYIPLELNGTYVYFGAHVGGEFVMILSDVTSVTVTPVPVPPAGILLACALGTLPRARETRVRKPRS